MNKKIMILGADEAGRGPWAGPLVVAMVVAENGVLDYADDSKKLTPKKRKELVNKIEKDAASISVGWASSEEIDRLGLANALKLASKRAFSEISKDFSVMIVDGKHNFTGIEDERVKTVIRADSLHPQVSAASIIAKTQRDAWMTDYASKYPQWGFDKHFGYGTKAHKESIEKYGLSDIHRRSFRPIAEYVSNSREAGRKSSS